MIRSIIKYGFVILCVISCVPYNNDSFYRENRISTYFKKSYKPIDSININRITICKQQNKNIDKKLITKGVLNISLKHVEENIVNDLKNNFKYLDFEIKNDTASNFNCAYLNRKNILSGDYKFNSKVSEKYNLQITLNFFYTSSRDANIDGFYGRTVEVLNYDEHFIYIVLRMAIFYDNKLIYMDNSGHQQRIYSAIDENVNYEIPQKTLDNLVTKGLAEYYKRLEQNLNK